MLKALAACKYREMIKELEQFGSKAISQHSLPPPPPRPQPPPVPVPPSPPSPPTSSSDKEGPQEDTTKMSDPVAQQPVNKSEELVKKVLAFDAKIGEYSNLVDRLKQEPSAAKKLGTNYPGEFPDYAATDFPVNILRKKLPKDISDIEEKDASEEQILRAIDVLKTIENQLAVDAKFVNYVESGDSFKKKEKDKVGQKELAKYLKEKKAHHDAFLVKQAELKLEIALLKAEWEICSPSLSPKDGPKYNEMPSIPQDPAEKDTRGSGDFAAAVGTIADNLEKVRGFRKKISGSKDVLSADKLLANLKDVQTKLSAIPPKSKLRGEYEKQIPPIQQDLSNASNVKDAGERLSKLQIGVDALVMEWRTFTTELNTAGLKLASEWAGVFANSLPEDDEKTRTIRQNYAKLKEELGKTEEGALATLNSAEIKTFVEKLKTLVPDFLAKNKVLLETAAKSLAAAKEEYNRLIKNVNAILVKEDNWNRNQWLKILEEAEVYAMHGNYVTAVAKLSTKPEPPPKGEVVTLVSIEETSGTTNREYTPPTPPEKRPGTGVVPPKRWEVLLSELELLSKKDADLFKQLLGDDEKHGEEAIEKKIAELRGKNASPEEQKKKAHVVATLRDNILGTLDKTGFKKMSSIDSDLRKSLSALVQSVEAKDETLSETDLQIIVSTATRKANAMKDDADALVKQSVAYHDKLQSLYGRAKILHGTSDQYEKELIAIKDTSTTISDAQVRIQGKQHEFEAAYAKRIEEISNQSLVVDEYRRLIEAYDELHKQAPNSKYLEDFGKRTCDFIGFGSKHWGELKAYFSGDKGAIIENIAKEKNANAKSLLETVRALQRELDAVVASPEALNNAEIQFQRASKENAELKGLWEKMLAQFKELVETAEKAVSGTKGDETQLDTLKRMRVDAEKAAKKNSYKEALDGLNSARKYAAYIIEHPEGTKLSSTKEFGNDVKRYKTNLTLLSNQVQGLIDEIKGYANDKDKDITDATHKAAIKRVTDNLSCLRKLLNAQLVIFDQLAKETKEKEWNGQGAAMKRKRREEGLSAIQKVRSLLNYKDVVALGSVTSPFDSAMEISKSLRQLEIDLRVIQATVSLWC
ncbi:MAG: hypothetical protein LBS59_08210 [Puniceicoccales bacterium]|nr:hypothetical protein [Puniceicoccales bacterium]